MPVWAKFLAFFAVGLGGAFIVRRLRIGDGGSSIVPSPPPAALLTPTSGGK